MANYSYGRKKRYKIKYKNLSILLAILLIIILLIAKGCSAIFSGRDDKKKPDRDNTLTSGDISPDDLPDINLPAADPATQSYYTFTSESHTSADIGEGLLALVNSNTPYRGSVTEDDLVVIREKKNSAYSVRDYTVKVLPEPMDALNSMLLAFYTATGNDGVMVRAGYRTLEYQQELYDNELKSTGQESSTSVAKAGYSEYHTGLCVDFTTYRNGTYKEFTGTGDYQWINDNCYKYGFVNRYPAGKESLTFTDAKPDHFRYVGIPHATVMQNYGFCLEEYIEFVRNYTIDTGFLSVTTDDGSQYMIYYVPMTDSQISETTNVYVPLKNVEPSITYPYEISGNNVDGWIVTFLFSEGNSITTIPQVTAPEDDTAPADGGEETPDPNTPAE